MSLHLIYVSTFIFLLLPSLFSAAFISKPGRPKSCGNVSVPYPFGVGSNCALDKYFTIHCNDSTHPPKPYLSTFINTEVVELNETYIRAKYPNLLSVCYDSSGVATYKQSTDMDWSGTPYRLSHVNMLTVIGCDVMVLQNNGSWLSGGCSPVCVDKNDRPGVGYCQFNDTIFGNGCCQVDIRGEDIGLVGAESFDLSGSLARRRHFPCIYAFIVEDEPILIRTLQFSYPLYYLDNSTAFINDNWASASRPPVVQLDWRINGAENCTDAKMKSSSYACRADKSICVDDFGYTGYRCSCLEGFVGNPYLDGGCKANSSFTSISKSMCSDQCGEISIQYPFGVGPSCSLAPSFEIICNDSTDPPKAYLHTLKAEIIGLYSTEVLVRYPNLGFACYNNISDYEHGVSKTEEDRLKIDLTATQYMLSDKNFISTIGCDDILTGIVRQGNRTLSNTSCASVCWAGEDGFTSCYREGTGCCGAPILKGTNYLEANFSDISGKWPRRKFFPCSFAFVEWYDPYSRFSVALSLMNNSTAIRKYFSSPSVLLDWRIGKDTCKEAKRNQNKYACQAHSVCVDVTNVGGYLCNCTQGYQGNPYLNNGCQDIDECADNTFNPCAANSTCVNTPGSFHCTCPKWYTGDGKKDGTGCTKDKSKIIFLIGICSGLGCIFLLLMIFWLYKMLQMRKKKMRKERFFKRNGGMLLQQQTNEGALGKTKVFNATELEVATDNFNASRILGQGGQGTVYKGMLPDGKIVAIKKSKMVKVEQLEQFINEVVILSQINHRNIVKLLGCCLETEVPLLVYEFMPNGTLFDLIHDPNNEFPFPWNMRLKIASDIAGALAYLHSSSSMPIYHRDIKSSNILLDEKYIVKVADFGTSKTVDVDLTHLTTMVKGTFGYLDPEYFQSSQFTEKSDVYSFGVVLVELLTRQRPISLYNTEEDRGLATRFLISMEEDCLDTILDPQVLEEHKKGQEILLVAKLAQRSLHLKGKMRPTMKEVATELESLKISQMKVISKDEYEEVMHFEHIPTATSDTDCTWTGSFKSVMPSSSLDIHPLMFTT